MKIMKDEHKVGYQFMEYYDKNYKFFLGGGNLHSLNLKSFTIFARRMCINGSYVHLNVIMTSHGTVK